jgi:asparagine synthase (glutamine-hydrolysing)
VREVANRWIPRRLSQRIKIGFWTTVFQRMEIPSAYFQDSSVRDLFELSGVEMRSLVEEADQDLRMRLLHLDVWSHVCLQKRPVEQSTGKLTEYVSIRPE